jgi:hypothetical protein
MHKIRNFHEGHSAVGEWQGSGRGRAWERHGLCESAFNTAGGRSGTICVNRPLTLCRLMSYIYRSYRTANLETLHFKYFFNKYPY